MFDSFENQSIINLFKFHEGQFTFSLSKVIQASFTNSGKFVLVWNWPIFEVIMHGHNKLRNHSCKTSANFHDFWPLPPYHRAYEGDFWSLCTVTFGPSAHGDTPPPLRHADVLNGWSLSKLKFSYTIFTFYRFNIHLGLPMLNSFQVQSSF